MVLEWTTVIEAKQVGVVDGWSFFSQQSIKPNEVGMTDEEYLAKCRKAFPKVTLRIKPSDAE